MEHEQSPVDTQVARTILSHGGKNSSHKFLATLGSLYWNKRNTDVAPFYVNIIVSACCELETPKGSVGGLDPPAPPDEEVTLAVEDFTESLTSRRKTDRFWVNLWKKFEYFLLKRMRTPIPSQNRVWFVWSNFKPNNFSSEDFRKFKFLKFKWT